MNSSSGIRNTWTFRLCQSRESRLSAEAISRLSVPPQVHEFVNHMFRHFINHPLIGTGTAQIANCAGK